MTIYRSYFSKNNTLISGNKTNNGRNPVCEISYGTDNKELSRYIFDVDLSLLNKRISDGIINTDNILSHTLNMTNTIRFAEEYVGKKSYNTTINRASDFTLDLFNLNQDWSEGTSYDFIYGVNYLNNIVEEESNWVNRKLGVTWDKSGAYSAGTNTIINSQHFNSGSENIKMDVTSVINNKLSGDTSNKGLGIKFSDYYENITTPLREAVAFHSKYTNTVFEPYIETIIDDIITDDRNFFYLDKENFLYLYSNDNIIINYVTIFDYEDNIYTIISGDSVINVSKGINKISLNIDSDIYPDSVIFRDVWNITINGKTKDINNMFYLISQDNNFNYNNEFNFNNYHFTFLGIKQNENINSDNIRKIKINIKELYQNQNNFIPLDIEYRIFSTIGSKYELDYIPFTKVNRTNFGYEFNLDPSWLIPQDYKLQLRLKNGDYYENKEIIKFRIVSDGINISNLLDTATTTEYIPTTTEYVATTTEYVATTTEYIPTTTEYISLPLSIIFDNITNANTLVGDSTNVDNWNTFFDLPTNGTPFSSVLVSINMIKLYGGNNIHLKNNLFLENNHLLSIEDNARCIISAGDGCFNNCSSLTNPWFPILETIGGGTFYGCTALTNPIFPSLVTANNSFVDCVNLTNPSFPSLVSAGDSCFQYCVNLTNPSFPSLVSAGESCFYSCNFSFLNFPLLKIVGNYCFSRCLNLTNINLPSLTNLGSTVNYNNVFGSINNNNINLIIPEALLMCNNGNPDGDIVYLQDNNNVTLNII